MADITGTASGETLDGTPDNDTIRGLGGNDELNGLGGNDSLFGDTGDDTMNGGEGDDTSYVDSAGDTVNEAVGEGIDTVITSVSFTLAAGQEIEFLRTYGSATTGALHLTGNEFANSVLGNNAANVLDGGAGADKLYGYGGDDIFHVDNSADRVFEAAAAGFDTVLTSVSFALESGQWIERLSVVDTSATNALDLTGNAFGSEIIGNDGDNIINARFGGDHTLRGNGGDDTYLVDRQSDAVFEAIGDGHDAIVTFNTDYVLPAGQEIEELRVSGPAGPGWNLTGNEFDNYLQGNNSPNRLDGGGGADTMAGLDGPDTYYVDDPGDIVLETPGSHTDVVITAISYALFAGQDVEVLRTWGSATTEAVDFTGNELANTLIGNAAVNQLDGKSGADALWGYGGADGFAFTTALGGGNVDTIVGLEVGVDEILLENAVFTGLAAGPLDPNAFHTGSAAADASDRIIYNSATGALLFDVDGFGGTAAVQFATVSTGLALTASDFVVI